MWRQFHKAYDRLESVVALAISGERRAIVGQNAAMDLYWSRQVNSLGVWQEWVGVPIAFNGATAHADAYACGTGSGGLPVIFCHTSTALDQSNFHVLKAVESRPNEWVWARTTIAAPAGFTGQAIPQVLPAQGDDLNPGAALYLSANGLAYRSQWVTGHGAPAWSPWVQINDATDQLVALSGSVCGGAGLVAAVFKDGSVKISIQELGLTWTKWKPVTKPPARAVAIKCITDALGVVHVFVSTKDGRIYKAEEQRVGRDGRGQWSAFTNTGFVPDANGSLKQFEITLDDNDRIQLVVLGKNGDLHQAWQKNWRGDPGHLARVLQDGRGRYTAFLRVMNDNDNFSAFCLFSDPAGRVHVVALPRPDGAPVHGLIWGYRLHIRAVKCRDDLDHPSPRPELTAQPDEFARTLEGCNAVYRNCGFSFVFDPKDDWHELANTAINRDTSLASGDNLDHWAYADTCDDAVVCFLRWGQWPDATGQSYSGGPFPDANGNSGRYVALSGFYAGAGSGNGMNQLQGAHLAHELGHYFGLAHTFNGPGEYPAGASQAQVFQHLIDLTLQDAGPFSPQCDVDRATGVEDTPYDPGPWLYDALSLGGGYVGANAAVTVTGNFGGHPVSYNIAPDTNNVMSYFAGNPPVVHPAPPPPPHHFSPDQIVLMHKALRHPLRAGLMRPPVT